MADEIAGYRLGRLARASGEFPRGQWCAVWGPKATRRRYGLEVGLERDKAIALAALAEFSKRRQAATIAVSDAPIATILAAYIADRRKAGRQLKSADSSAKALNLVFGAMKPETIEAPVMVEGQQRTLCHAYAVQRHAQGKSRDTVWTELLLLRTALNWAVENGLIAKAPKVWIPSKGPARNIMITEDEAARLIEGCVMPHLRAFVIIALCTAARRGAILELTWDRCDFDRGTVDFNRGEKRGILDSGFQKGRTVTPMSALLRYALLEAKAGARTPYVIEWNGQRVADVKTGFIAAVRRAGLAGKRISPHVLRHATASWLADDNLDMRKIQKLLGHRSQKTTETIYANKSAQAYLTEATDAIGARLKRVVGGEGFEPPTARM